MIDHVFIHYYSILFHLWISFFSQYLKTKLLKYKVLFAFILPLCYVIGWIFCNNKKLKPKPFIESTSDNLTYKFVPATKRGRDIKVPLCLSSPVWKSLI